MREFSNYFNKFHIKIFLNIMVEQRKKSTPVARRSNHNRHPAQG